MMDRWARSAYAPAVGVVARRLGDRGVTANQVTLVGLVVGLSGCALIAAGRPILGVTLFLINRVIDGIDGAIARLAGSSRLGPHLDFLADHLIYEGFLVGLAIARPDARLAIVVLLATYTLNTVSLLGVGPILEELGATDQDDRGLLLPTGLVEGAETMLAYVLMGLVAPLTAPIAWVFAGLVAFTAAARIVNARRLVKVTDGDDTIDAASRSVPPRKI